MRKLIIAATLMGTLTPPGAALAHQPVMDMAPRWADGYGFQIRQEFYGSDKMKSGTSSTANPNALEKSVEKTWLEGVYTFDRSKRVTFKLPYVRQWRTKMDGATKVKQSESGLGDLIVAMPLKKYTNKVGFTSNWGFTPQLRLPTGSSDGDFPISDGSTDVGLSLSYSSEQADGKYQLYDLFYWFNTPGARGMNEGNELGFDLNYGTKFGHNNNDNSGYFALWDVSARHKSEGKGLGDSVTGGSRISTGPVFVMYKNSYIFRTEFKMPVYENVQGTQLSRGTEFTLGVGVTF